jgi:simple sugar transport system ATP-binding protein/ribose transport system ATP-binding protein
VRQNDESSEGGAETLPSLLDDWHVETRGLVKRFGGTEALSGVDVRIRRATVHALIGENGAGKSTLGRVIAGAVAPDQGELLVDGVAANFHNPRQALRARIALIAQELALAPKLTVLENVFLGLEPTRAGLLSRRLARKRYAALDERVGFGLDPNLRAGELRIADQQKVEIMRALARDAALIIMDEPTAALPAADHERLFEVVHGLRRNGVTIVYVSHFLEEALALADDVTVLKDGAVVLASPASEQTSGSLVRAMIGRELNLAAPLETRRPAESQVVFSARGLRRAGAFEDVSFDLRAGEILGLAGLVGAGRSELARAIFGADRLDGGTVSLDGRTLKIRHPADAIRVGIAMLPESRKDQGLLMRRPIRENLSLPHLRELGLGPFVDERRERRSASAVAQKVDLRAASLSAPVRSLSGGNQQKTLFGKWLGGTPRMLIVDEPTRGVDVGAKNAIQQLIASLAAEGAAVLVISSEFDEIARLAHRALVMRTGRIVGEFSGPDLNGTTLMRAAFGDTAPSAA